MNAVVLEIVKQNTNQKTPRKFVTEPNAEKKKSVYKGSSSYAFSASNSTTISGGGIWCCRVKVYYKPITKRLSSTLTFHHYNLPKQNKK